jgi:hypothetical protein
VSSGVVAARVSLNGMQRAVAAVTAMLPANTYHADKNLGTFNRAMDPAPLRMPALSTYLPTRAGLP